MSYTLRATHECTCEVSKLQGRAAAYECLFFPFPAAIRVMIHTPGELLAFPFFHSFISPFPSPQLYTTGPSRSNGSGFLFHNQSGYELSHPETFCFSLVLGIEGGLFFFSFLIREIGFFFSFLLICIYLCFFFFFFAESKGGV